MKTPRITIKYLINWINEQWNAEDRDFEVTDIYKTSFTQDQYEGGAARLIIRFKHKGDDKNIMNHYFYCFASIKHLNEAVKNGYKLHLKYSNYLTETELTYKEI